MGSPAGQAVTLIYGQNRGGKRVYRAGSDHRKDGQAVAY
jgi:hypothetical protein